jgi:quercetin dioxygenase-like cupin family protein
VVLYATDLEQARSSVLAAGGTITREIFSFPGGRRFHFQDPGGNELAVWSESGPGESAGPEAVPPVARAELLTAAIAGSKAVDRVEVQRIEMAPGLASGLHLHPCPVVGVVTRGSVLFQVEGEPARVLKAGDAFHEPANARVPHFDAQEEGASFVAFYLLGADETELLRMLE